MRIIARQTGGGLKFLMHYSQLHHPYPPDDIGTKSSLLQPRTIESKKGF